jgi:hypothetical protein
VKDTLEDLSLTVSLQPTRSVLDLEVLLGDEFWDARELEFSAISLWR